MKTRWRYKHEFSAALLAVGFVLSSATSGPDDVKIETFMPNLKYRFEQLEIAGSLHAKPETTHSSKRMLKNSPRLKYLFESLHTATFDILESRNIRIALLLDTSSSMDGLIEQAKSQLWRIVMELSGARKGGEDARLEIALYEYGNDWLSSSENWIRQVTPFTTDLDEISKQLFELRTNGGSEYCGAVIEQSINDLDWMKETEGLQVIFIAGNESFDQGDISFQNACEKAISSGIIVNTIFCGDKQWGIDTKWKQGADLTEGFYGNIDMNSATVYIETPYDEEIMRLNNELNSTYISYGAMGNTYSWNMLAQDANAASYSTANCVDRITVKCSHLYTNGSWDLVDAVKDSSFDLKSVKKEDLPAEMQTMSISEQKKYVETKSTDRAEIQARINELSEKRAAYIRDREAETGVSENSLDYAIIQAIKKQAMERNFVFKN